MVPSGEVTLKQRLNKVRVSSDGDGVQAEGKESVCSLSSSHSGCQQALSPLPHMQWWCKDRIPALRAPSKKGEHEEHTAVCSPQF